MERDASGLTNEQLKAISTHTLTWSVTIWDFEGIYTKFISTHTLTWSVTDKSYLYFFAVIISTHTLTWSVTVATLQL